MCWVWEQFGGRAVRGWERQCELQGCGEGMGLGVGKGERVSESGCVSEGG